MAVTPYTQFRWQDGKRTSGAPLVGNYADSRYSPSEGTNYLWRDCPRLAALCDPSVGYSDRNDCGKPVDANEWTTTQATAGTVALSVATNIRNGFWTFDTGDSTAAHGPQIQRKQAEYAVAANKDIWWECNVLLSDAVNSDFCAGLSVIDTALMASGDISITDGIMFVKPKDTAVLKAVTVAGSSVTTKASIATLASILFRFGFHVVSNTRVDFYVQNSFVGSIAATIPTAALTTSFGYHNGTTPGAALQLYLDSYDGFQIR